MFPVPNNGAIMLTLIQDSRAKGGRRLAKLNRRRAIAERCLNCSGFEYSSRENCQFGDCQLHPYRTGKGKQNASARSEAIRAYCRDFCMEGSSAYVSKCSSPECPLFVFRLSKIDKSVEVGA